MLVLKNWDTNLHSREKKTLWSFLFLYAFLVLISLFFVAFLYYDLQRELFLQHQKEALSNLTNEQINRLKTLHVTFDKERLYPRDERFNSAIYDSGLHEIFSTLRSQNVNLYDDIYIKEHKIYFIKELESYYLGARYIALEVPEPAHWDKKIYRTLFLYGGIIFALTVLIGYFLLKLLLRPMRDAISLLDRFIKDTTHELNTPVNTILSNIEMIDPTQLDPALLKKINRITIASKTISNLYDDLTYLILSHRLSSHDETVDLQLLLEERLEYFSLLCESKKIRVGTCLEANVVMSIDRKKITKLLDNILSNAVKYNHIGGTIDVELHDKLIRISDSGRGMDASKTKHAFERYVRFDRSVGGFGIGLSIVAAIAKEYGLNVDIESKRNEGTKVSISW
ncbi:HAMP domain-containing sensor histidine kinase [Sulfurospirillum sp. hDNRA2]|uniref:sensor histidine kinase n=1 Tax=Sulfurospirillum sp. hDNRA2 TaxID=3237298 RepID=UPI0020B7B88E|nr:HAMP domain-containing sensor histidine kinase [Sulfurospirillum sp. DNRA8]MCP3652421.1 HAMP domain-containing histidine kinase [Sulfurospirillum sp. DNRA8]MCR1811272.1 HAMP domain-containing histidine kinase [Sulfurospirillum sp. DNRA8]